MMYNDKLSINRIYLKYYLTWKSSKIFKRYYLIIGKNNDLLVFFYFLNFYKIMLSRQSFLISLYIKRNNKS